MYKVYFFTKYPSPYYSHTRALYRRKHHYQTTRCGNLLLHEIRNERHRSSRNWKTARKYANRSRRFWKYKPSKAKIIAVNVHKRRTTRKNDSYLGKILQLFPHSHCHEKTIRLLKTYYGRAYMCEYILVLWKWFRVSFSRTTIKFVVHGESAAIETFHL